MKTLGLLGTKVGMTKIFHENGEAIPVTLIKAGPCPITQIKTVENDGYNAVQLGFGEIIKEKNVIKPVIGHFKKNNLKPCKWLKEFRMDKLDGYTVGQEIKTDIFSSGEYVDVSGITKGKGFQGAVKRHNFGGGPRTHGQSDRLRAVGAIGSQCPQRVKKNMRMPGHMGDEWNTVQKIEIVQIVPEENLLLVKGSIPGVNDNLVIINKTVKSVKSKQSGLLDKKIAGKGKAKTQKAEKKKAAKK